MQAETLPERRLGRPPIIRLQVLKSAGRLIAKGMTENQRASSRQEQMSSSCMIFPPLPRGRIWRPQTIAETSRAEPPRQASRPRSVNNRGRLLWAPSLALVSWLTFYAAPEAGCQTNNGELLSIQRLPADGYWIAGSSSLQSVSPLNNARLAAVAGDSILEFRGGYGALPTSLYLQTNSSVASIAVYSFPPSLSEEVLLPTPFGDFALMFTTTNPAMPREIWKGDLSLTNWTRVFKWPAASNVPPSTTVLRQGWSADTKGNIYLGEYNSDDAAYPDYQMHIYKGTNYGENWSAVYTFPPRNITGPDGGVRHIHACEVDPYTGHVWIATGDTDSQARIYYHTNALLPDADGIVRLTLVGSGSQEYRAVSLAFTENYIYWFMDAPSNPQKMFRIHRASSYPVLSPQTPTEQDYRECLGVFPDKPFYYSRVVKSTQGDIILVVSHYEDAARYGTTFREVDNWNRVFGIKESIDSTVQVQEVFAVRATAKFAYFDPMGQNSRGEIFFKSGDVAGVNTAAGYKGTLDWNDAPAYAGSNYLSLHLSWTSQTNSYYQIKGSQDLNSNGWYNVGLGFHGDGLTNWLYYSAGNQGDRFFRLGQ
jgi:hypothetical protein